MIDYLEVVGRLTAIRDDLRNTLNSEISDRQIAVEQTEMLLSKLLGELVTPDPQICSTCLDNGTERPAVGIADDGQGVCHTHIMTTLLGGRGVRTSPDEVAKLLKLAVNSEYGKAAGVPAGASSRGDAYCSSCNADLWFNPEKAEYVALFDAPCPATTNHKHSARR